MKILFAGSSGGHLAQLVNLKSWWANHERIWLTFNTPDATSVLAEEIVEWADHSPDRSLGNLLTSLRLALRVLSHHKPDVVISAGASLGALCLFLAHLRGIPTVYIEVFDRITLPSLSGKLCYRFVDVFAVQWEAQKQLYPRAQVIGPLL